MTPQRACAIELLEKFPGAHTKTLATIAVKQNPSLFLTLEHARSAFRRLRGASGHNMRRQSTDKRFHRPPGKSGDPFAKLAEGKKHFQDWSAFAIEGPARALVLSDVHIPFHDLRPTVAALRHGKKLGCDLVLLNGDIADFFSVSRWESDPRKRNLADELKAVREFLAAVRDGFPKARIIYKLGNHEERWERYLSVKAPELLGVEDFRFDRILDLAALGIEVVSEKRPIVLGKLNIIHGHEIRFNISNPVNPARGYFLRAKAHVLGGHLHQTSQHSEKTLDQKVVAAWSTGCLCDLHPDHAPVNNWNHGAAAIEVDKAGAFHVENFRIIDGAIY